MATTLYVMTVGGGEFAAMYAEDKYGIKRVFNEHIHHGKTQFAGDGCDFEILTMNKGSFSSKQDRDEAMALLDGVCDDVIDYDDSKNTNVFLFTEDDIWAVIPDESVSEEEKDD